MHPAGADVKEKGGLRSERAHASPVTPLTKRGAAAHHEAAESPNRRVSPKQPSSQALVVPARRAHQPYEDVVGPGRDLGTEKGPQCGAHIWRHSLGKKRLKKEKVHFSYFQHN